MLFTLPCSALGVNHYVSAGLHKVMLDVHLDELYQVETKVLNQAVRRNADRFPLDFMFQLNVEETDS